MNINKIYNENKDKINYSEEEIIQICNKEIQKINSGKKLFLKN
jgi:hypothetical protein